MNNPNIAILLLTYQRTDYAVQTIKSLCSNLRYWGKLAWYVADNGSNGHHVNSIMATLSEYSQRIIGSHSEKNTCGKSWNKGLVECYKHSDYVLVMEDDWTLGNPFDITPYVQLLEQRQDVGMVRFGTLTLGMICHVEGHNGRHYLRMDKGPQYAFSGNPHLRHKRLNETVGLYNETIHPSPGDVEIDFDSRFRQQDKVEIWRPASIDGWGVFSHIGNVQSYEVD